MALTREEKEKKIRPVGFEFSFDTNRKKTSKFDLQYLLDMRKWLFENKNLWLFGIFM